VVQYRELLGAPDRVPGWQHQTQRRELQALGSSRQVAVEQQRRYRDLPPLGVEVVLGRRQGVDSDLVAQNGQVANLVHHRGDRREYHDVEFHASPLGCLKLLN
jgi:hypothetical protein